MADTPFSGALPLAKPSFHLLGAGAEPDRLPIRPICMSR
jgi:hypothetical protein